MSVLATGVNYSPNASYFLQTSATSLAIPALTNISSINGAKYPATALTATSLAVSTISGVSTINGTSYPPASGPKIIYGITGACVGGTGSSTQNGVLAGANFTSATSYNLQVTPVRAGAALGLTWSVTQDSATGFTVYWTGQSGNSWQFNWVAIGT